MQGQIAFIVVVIILAIIFAGMSLRIVRPYQRGLIERLGRYRRTCQPGLNFIMPIIETMAKMDMRERVIDVPPQSIITKDNVVVEVDAVIYCQVTDPFKAHYEIMDFVYASVKLAQTNLRNTLGDMELDQSLTSRDVINEKLRLVMDEATNKWGVKVNRVEIQKIDPPRDITDAMSRQMKAEREKRAAILEAEGVKQADITRAEGEKQAVILDAEGQAESVRKRADAKKYQKLTVAQGEAEAIVRVFNAIHEGKPDEKIITLRYLDSLKQIANGEANKVFFPIEVSSLLSSVGLVSDMLKDKNDKKLVPENG